MATVIDQLSDITRNLDALALAMRDISFTETESQTLDALAASLKDAVVVIESKAGSCRRLWSEQAWKDSEEHRIKAQTTIVALLTNGKLRNSAVFRRNIKLIYQGPPHSEFDSKDTKWRKEVIQKRCRKIQQLSPDGVVSWAIAYPPTSWGPCFMPNDIFDLCETLLKLKDGEAQGCTGLEQLVHELAHPSQRETEVNNHDILGRVVEPMPRNPNNVNREMKHMFTNAPAATSVLQLPQPFRGAAQNSAQWKWERSQGYGTTACVATLFPKDETQDVSFTIWCGHNDGYRLNDIYGVKHALSS
ncbi:hypothetical protein TOPH_06086 [Tolypocladium ophioglossoides CBS 100239]|uniref:Uncharacterized protein n=1 Tax=Tolypocladium ophioglossoides (strain CBS 100239) TaxID=1163406 RepID=A0A0L0N662_TOLOC|nr:hypothetical protein TOPH_06086 [Tolypocladium ophioglossoides CBS 100239]